MMRIWLSAGRVVDLGTGEYTAKVTATTAGAYSVYIKHNGCNIAGSPFPAEGAAHRHCSRLQLCGAGGPGEGCERPEGDMQFTFPHWPLNLHQACRELQHWQPHVSWRGVHWDCGSRARMCQARRPEGGVARPAGNYTALASESACDWSMHIALDCTHILPLRRQKEFQVFQSASGCPERALHRGGP